MRLDDRLVVLDVHGVVFSNPLVPFLAEMAGQYGREGTEVLQAWSTRLRRPFWLGQLGEAELWTNLFPGCDPVALSAELEGRYEAGPLFHRLDTISDPIWLLSNHRSEWLIPRIARLAWRVGSSGCTSPTPSASSSLSRGRSTWCVSSPASGPSATSTTSRRM